MRDSIGGKTSNKARRPGKGDPSRLLPPLALAIVMCAGALPAIASGAGANALPSDFSDLANADGYYANIQAPDPTVTTGVRSFTHVIGYFDLGSLYLNSVGYGTWDSSSNRMLVYQIADNRGNFYYSAGTYSPYDVNGFPGAFSAGMWRSSGNTWHFNWWGPNFNYGLDQGNNYGSYSSQATSLGPDGWGGCPNSYPVRFASAYMYRNKNSGYWYYMPVTHLYQWGSSPTWGVWGDASWGGSIGYGTGSCP